jgi:hypothetical protein
MNIELADRLDKYITEFNDDVSLSLSNIKDKSLMVTSYQSKWIRYYFLEKTLNQKLKDAKVEYSKKYANKIDFNQQPIPGLKSTIDENLTKLNNELRTSELCLDFIEKSMAVLDKINFQIKNVIDLVKLENC